jgi:hypothetical protein
MAKSPFPRTHKAATRPPRSTRFKRSRKTAARPPPRSAARFKELELARAVRAARRAGGTGVQVDPTTGKICVLLGKPSEPVQDAAEQL